MSKLSAGLLVFRQRSGADVEILIVHPGGPFWAKKDDGAWSVPKGEHDEAEDPWTVARREFAEELGQPAPGGVPIDLGVLRQSSGKQVHCFALEGDVNIDAVVSNEFSIEWPPRSGRMQSFPEVDRAGWFGLEAAREKLNPAQGAFVDRLRELLD